MSLWTANPWSVVGSITEQTRPLLPFGRFQTDRCVIAGVSASSPVPTANAFRRQPASLDMNGRSETNRPTEANEFFKYLHTPNGLHQVSASTDRQTCGHVCSALCDRRFLRKSVYWPSFQDGGDEPSNSVFAPHNSQCQSRFGKTVTFLWRQSVRPGTTRLSHSTPDLFRRSLLNS